jgi:proteic killer suppression protein
MIKGFKHKGLELFFTTGNIKSIQAEHEKRLFVRLQALHTAIKIEDMSIPGFRLHQLKGERKDTWSINVSGNWRVTFEFSDGHAYVVNYEDYH